MVHVEDFKRGMQALVAGVTVITTGEDESRRGLTATSVCSLTIEPPMLVACVNHKSATYNAIESSGVFAVNLLSRGHVEIAKMFADPARSSERFQTGDWSILQTGAPILMDSVASFDCRVHDAIAVTTHTIFIGTVKAVRVDPGMPPLAYSGAQWGRFELGLD